MKIIGKFLACALLTISAIVQPMDKPKKKKPSKTKLVANWVRTAGNIILGNAPVEKIQQPEQGNPLAMQEAPFAKLPAEIRFTIIDNLRTAVDAKSLMQVANAIKTLSHTNKQLNNMFNEPNFCLALIKHYAKVFETNDTMTCALLRTSGTKKRLFIQNTLIKDICENTNPDRSQFEKLITLGFDPYFTDVNDDTPAELCIRNYNLAGLEMLLNAGVDPEFIGKNGISLYDLAANRPNRKLALPMIELLDLAIYNKNQ